MYIVVIGWLYVVLMMSVTEHSVIAAIMTFLLYGLLPLTIILYVTGAPARRRKKIAEEKMRIAKLDTMSTSAPETTRTSENE